MLSELLAAFGLSPADLKARAMNIRKAFLRRALDVHPDESKW